MTFIQTSRCTGGCCENFCVSPDMDPGEWRKRFLYGLTVPEQPEHFVYLGWSPPWKEFSGHRYKCTWLTPSGDCAHYDERPNMCRTYPDEATTNGACSREGCTRRGYWATGCRGKGLM